MQKTRVFKSGNSMAIRLPKGFILNGSEVEILKRDNEIIIREIPRDLAAAFALLAAMPSDFFEHERQDLPPQDREFE